MAGWGRAAEAVKALVVVRAVVETDWVASAVVETAAAAPVEAATEAAVRALAVVAARALEVH